MSGECPRCGFVDCECWKDRIQPPLSFRDQCVLAMLSNPGAGGVPGTNDAKWIFYIADSMDAERTRREGT